MADGVVLVNPLFPENVSVLECRLRLRCQVFRLQLLTEPEVLLGLHFGLVQVPLAQAALGQQSMVVHFVQFVDFLFFARNKAPEILNLVFCEQVQSHLNVNVAHFHRDFRLEHFVAALRTRVEALFVEPEGFFLLVDFFFFFPQFFVDFDQLLGDLFRVPEGDSGDLFGFLQNLDRVLEVPESLETRGQPQIRLN